MSDSGGFTLVDFSIPARDLPMIHPHADAPLCTECLSLDYCFFNPSCYGCQDLLLDIKTSISHLFAVMRQWVPQTQRNMPSLTREILRRGANVNDRDGLTDLTLLHFASKSGAAGVGNEIAAANLVKSLISKGAETEMRCRWTDMNALHYAVFFDSPEVVEALADHNPSLVMSICSEFGHGNGLHIAAANMSLGAAKVLLRYGADGSLKNSNGNHPVDCIPEKISKDLRETCSELTDILKNASENPPPKTKHIAPVPSPKKSLRSHSHAPPPRTPTPNRLNEAALSAGPAPKSPTAKTTGNPKSPAPSQESTISTTSTRVTEGSSGWSRNPSPVVEELSLVKLGLKVGDRVIIDSTNSRPKRGTVRFGGTTEFQPGQWAGVELDSEIGKNDGSYGGIRYFTCKPKFGVFVPMHRISKALHQPPDKKKRKKSEQKTRDSLYITNKAIEAQAQIKMNSDLQVGEKVVMSGSRTGVLRFSGSVSFAPGFWMGVELDIPNGKNNGTVSGVKYFPCRPNHGVFVLPSKVSRYLSPSQTSLTVPSTNRSKHHLKAPHLSHPTSSSSSNESTDYSSAGVASLNGLSAAGGSSDASASSPYSSPSTARRRGAHSNRPRSKGHLQLSGSGSSRTSSPIPLSLAASPDIVLVEGMSVLVSKELGIVRFIGETQFSPGAWIGVELRKPNGKNDGSVQGKKYFNCKPKYGLFVKPEKATHRGINCAKILPAQLKTALKT